MRAINVGERFKVGDFYFVNSMSPIMYTWSLNTWIKIIVAGFLALVTMMVTKVDHGN